MILNLDILNLDELPPGRRLRILRAARGLTLWELGLRSGLRDARICELELGRRAGSAAEWERLRAALAAAEG